ncbi:MAG: alpha/beta fold hydrolase, partial [Janthinobacterium lividum]
MISVEEYGDPAGPPVLYFHGWPASRLEAGLIPDLSVRLLALDRPGYGRSTPQPGRTLLDWPADVAAVADRLGLAKFHVVGLSGGGPYAAACALALPDR